MYYPFETEAYPVGRNRQQYRHDGGEDRQFGVDVGRATADDLVECLLRSVSDRHDVVVHLLPDVLMCL